MKKLIAAAVATSVTAIAFADVSITGNASYEYMAKEDTTGKKSNYSDTELNLKVVGKTGDTTVVANFEIDGASENTAVTAFQVEDVYLATKIGDFNVKAGDFASGTTALGGEIDNGGRAIGKVDVNTTIGGVKLGYAVNHNAANSYDVYDTDAAAVYGSYNLAGHTIAFKDNSDSYTIMGAQGSVAGIDYRIEQKDNDSSTTGDVLFYQIGGKVGGLDVSYAAIDADKASAVTEDDSAIFAREMAASNVGLAGVNGVNQITASTVIDGTTVTAKIGELTGIADKQDAAFSQISAKRKLASGTTINVSYDDYETHNIDVGSTMTDTQVFEIDLSVAF